MSTQEQIVREQLQLLAHVEYEDDEDKEMLDSAPALAALDDIMAVVKAANTLADGLSETVSLECEEFTEDERLTCPEKHPTDREGSWCVLCDVRFQVAVFRSALARLTTQEGDQG